MKQQLADPKSEIMPASHENQFADRYILVKFEACKLIFLRVKLKEFQQQISITGWKSSSDKIFLKYYRKYRKELKA